MIIGIDLDSVCVSTTQAVCEYINERLPVNLSLEDITSYSIEAALPEQYRWIVNAAFNDAAMWKKVKMISNCAKYIEKLYDDGHEIYFATSSLPQNLRKKINHLSRNMDFLPEDYIINHTINIRNKQLLRFDILIDDCLDNLTGDRTYFSIALDYPWNRTDADTPRFARAHNWKEIYEEVQNVIALEYKYI